MDARRRKMVLINKTGQEREICIYIYEWFENSLKIARTFRWVQFERIFKYHEFCKSLIARDFIRLLIYYMTERIKKTRVLICTAVQIKN